MSRRQPPAGTRRRCELTRDPAQRAAANALTDSLKPELPAGLARPALRALAAAGITRIEHFGRITEAELLGLHGLGPRALDVIRQAVADAGIEFRH